MGKKKKGKRAGTGVGTLVDIAAAGIGLASLASEVLERRRHATAAESPVLEPQAESPGKVPLDRTAKLADVALGTVHALLDLNAAPPEALRSLPKIGRKRAGKILAHRPFGRVKDLKKVLPKRVYKRIKHRLTV
jgi:DNA uptake protein ComE-like DNA-binding protein